jgi:serine/threonine protein kinase
MEQFPQPGNGFTIREKLGEGNWKTAYRATSMHSAGDVAILYFHDESMQKAFTGEVLAQLRAAKTHKFSDYIAEFKGLSHDDEGRWYMVEELLARPLDRLGVVNDIVRFVRIARDLCRGLTCLHDSKLVHRDIKLENCGLDHQERGKLFDLGLVTSDPREIRGNVFTRSPELFDEGGLLRVLRPRFSSDVWALGATLYALRFGEYPFVHRSEIERRNQINVDFKSGKLNQEEAKKLKDSITDQARVRSAKSNAFDVLSKKAKSQLSGTAGDILVSMLEFDEKSRRTAESYAEEWARLARDLGGVIASSSDNPNKWEEIEQNLQSVLKKDLAITRKQIERLATELRDEKKRKLENPALKAAETLITKIKNRERATLS